MRALLFALLFATFGWTQSVPKNVKALWADFDPRKDPLDVKIVREWKQDKIVYRSVTFHIGTFKGKKSRMAAFYGFPEGGKDLCGLLQIHGGGQRANLREVQFYAQRGYAVLSVNWGGREMEQAKPGDENTDWGAVDPTQKNVQGYFNLRPGKLYLDKVESPRNNNWYLLTLGCRRGLTFLEQQKEVDQKKLGVYGHSMGGNLTVYVAGTDDRVKVASPSVGGQGFRTVPFKLLPQQRRRQIRGDLKLYRATLGFQSYAPHIKVPLLWLGATNDFHGIMDDTYRTGKLIPHQNVRYVFAPHLNHRFTPPFAVTRPLWLDQYLKGTMKFPPTPTSKLVLNQGVPILEVSPKGGNVEKVHIYYSIDPDPQARFWRSTDAVKQGSKWSAKLPILSTRQPLFAFANVHYRLKKLSTVPFAPPTKTMALSTMLHTATPSDLQKAKVLATDKVSTSVIDDFSRGWRDWYRLNERHRQHWQFWTRKISDEKWRGRGEDELTFDVRVEKANDLVVTVTENFFRNYRGRSEDYVAIVPLKERVWQTVRLTRGDFRSVEKKKPLKSWAQIDLLGYQPYYRQKRGKVLWGTLQWKGAQPELRNLRWTRK